MKVPYFVSWAYNTCGYRLDQSMSMSEYKRYVHDTYGYDNVEIGTMYGSSLSEIVKDLKNKLIS